MFKTERIEMMQERYTHISNAHHALQYLVPSRIGSFLAINELCNLKFGTCRISGYYLPLKNFYRLPDVKCRLFLLLQFKKNHATIADFVSEHGCNQVWWNVIVGEVSFKTAWITFTVQRELEAKRTGIKMSKLSFKQFNTVENQDLLKVF